ncbi:GNAT family N-acetyltransferase [Sagittula salina]|uniref:GNAT family N-acetyltransferase n=1 Tax=Sagittula salina TaxID=2820268 RepID=A0A940S4Z2_9RHOB|nr:GNAT family protein [Sagittula salina]MBP0484415.1 GNAT family N-acetyltransferase [Sagittula salina]
MAATRFALDTTHLVLRSMDASDAGGPYRDMFADPAIMNAMNLPARRLTEAELAGYIAGFDGRTRVLLGAWERGTGTFCGFWTVTIDQAQGSATLDMALDRGHPRCGLFALESTLAVSDWLYRSGIEKAVAHVLVENRRAARLFHAIGMTLEGTLRGELRDRRGGNGRVDLLRFGLLRSEFPLLETRIARLIARSGSLSGGRFRVAATRSATTEGENAPADVG